MRSNIQIARHKFFSVNYIYLFRHSSIHHLLGKLEAMGSLELEKSRLAWPT